MQVPGFLLRRLYVKGSLRNANGGFEFDLKNTLGSGNAEQVLPLTLDGEELPVDATTFIADGTATSFDQVSATNPMTLGMNKTITIAFSGRALSTGKHKLGIGFVVPGMGRLEFDVTDAIEGSEEAGDVS